VEIDEFRSSGSATLTVGHAMHTGFDAHFDMITSGQAVVVSALRDPYLAGLSSPHGNMTKNPAMRHTGPLPDGMKQRPIGQWNALIAAWDRLQAEGLTMPFMQVEEDDPDKRRDILINIADHVGVDYEVPALDAYVSAWEPVGKSRVTPLKQEYLDSGTIGGEALTHLDFAESWMAPRRVVTAAPPRPARPAPPEGGKGGPPRPGQQQPAIPTPPAASKKKKATKKKKRSKRSTHQRA